MGINAPIVAQRGFKDRLKSVGRHRGVQYALSLPERIVRSASAVSAGVVREVADVALPIGVRRGRLYRTLVEASLRFLIEDVGRVEGTYPSDEKLTRDFLVRRTVGNGIDVMGVLAFHASPVWVLAALADVCGAGRQLIPEIAQSLKDEGLLAPGESFTTMEQLLQGLERTSAQLADSMNTPPLDVAGLREEWAKVATEARRLPAPPSFFEATTAVALDVFRRRAVDVAVLEVGLGGRLDATNIVTPVAAAITAIDLDHQAHLGPTLEAIARLDPKTSAELGGVTELRRWQLREFGEELLKAVRGTAPQDGG